MTRPQAPRPLAPFLGAGALLLLGALILPGRATSQGAPEDAPEGWEIELSTPVPADDGRAPLEDVMSVSCWGCHQTIAEEWATTLHAQAWDDPFYQEALQGKRRPQSCYGCHVPQPLHLMPPERFGRKPRPRLEEDERFHLGISCRSCHEGPEGTILGPWGAETDSHASVQSESFSTATGSNKLCIACHQTTVGPVIGIAKDFVLADLEARGMSCVGCHMAPVERPMATDDDDNPTQVRTGRSHLLQTPRDPGFLAKSFGLTARDDGGETVLTIANRAGHRVPGLVERTITFEVVGIDGSGNEVARTTQTVDSTAYLPLEGSVEVRLGAAAAAVRVAR